MLTSDGVALEVLDLGGAGRPIVLLHGLMSCARSWLPRAAALRPHGRLLAPDARGHGRSATGADTSPHRLADDVGELLATTGPAALVGHSMGGISALLTAARHPGLVTAVVVEDSPFDLTGGPPGLLGDMREWFGAVAGPYPSRRRVAQVLAGGRPEVGAHMARCTVRRDDGWWLAADVDAAVAIAGHWTRRSLLDDVAGVAAPTLVIEAGESVVAPGQLAALAARLPDARHVRLPGTGHLVHDADPGGWAAEVTALLRRTAGPDAGR